MNNKDPELERLRAEIDMAKREIANAASAMDSINSRRDAIKNQINSVNYRISDIKRSIDSEYEAMRICYSRKDRIDGDNHKYRAQGFKDGLQREYSEKESLYRQLDCLKPEYESTLSRLRSLKEKKRIAYEQFNSRLEHLKAQNEAQKAKWHTKPCAKCGRQIRYHEDWDHIPNICKECKGRR